MATTLYLMRHGHVHNPKKILYGRLPGYYLSELGRQQAHSAGLWLQGKPITSIYSSPMERAQQTAAIVAEYQDDLNPVLDERIIEVFTPHEGELTAKLEAANWDLYSGNQPPYETPPAVLNRVHNFFDYLLERHQNESVVAVGHGDILVFSWLHAQGWAPDAHMKENLLEYRLPEEYPATASIMSFVLSGPPREVAPSVSYLRPY